MRLSSCHWFVVWLMLWATCSNVVPAAVPRISVIPRPRVEHYENPTAVLGKRQAILTLTSSNDRTLTAAAVQTGGQLLAKRLRLLGQVRLTTDAQVESANFVVHRITADELLDKLREKSAEHLPCGTRLTQAYVLQTNDAANMPQATVFACSDVGAYYALVSLCQLLDADQAGNIVLPTVTIADWPEIGLRLAKTSASTNPVAYVERYRKWLPLYKFSAIGLQFHGKESKHPTQFTNNVATLCREIRDEGVLRSIVYFCPFRGKGLDFNAATDREAYSQLIQSFLENGADGIEVDYNDWPGEGTPIEDVINLACDAAAKKDREALVLYCPPNRGASQYRGPASAEMRRILSNVPKNVWPLWTGMATLIERPLTVEQVKQWTDAAGRRPFLWVNRVSPHVPRAFTRTVKEVPDALVFRGDLLPKELNGLFEGVHFNAGFSAGYNDLPATFDLQSIAYMATAADYVWNPRQWNAVESARRAQRFATIMQPLIGN